MFHYQHNATSDWTVSIVRVLPVQYPLSLLFFLRHTYSHVVFFLESRLEATAQYSIPPFPLLSARVNPSAKQICPY